jgi:hypothetical protein
VNSVIGVDADEVRVEGRVVDFGQRQATGCPNCSSASMMIWAASSSRGSGRWEIAHRPP